MVEVCEKCEEQPGDVKCSCGAEFCENCFMTKHIPRNLKHRRGGTSKTDKAWAWITGTATNLADSAARATHFERDEATKWFGLYIQKANEDRVTRLVETPRFSHLIEKSIHQRKDSPQRQFPSIVSFVGETGAGKSTLIRSLIVNALYSESLNLEAPVPGVRTGPSACLPTTGEVNLYLDPDTFGTKTPHFFADCEGMLGGEPIAAQHQKEWSKHGRRYLLQSKDGIQIDRKTAVMTIYPRFLYLFSDVICMVTRNQKAWADSAVKLLEWSRIGAHSTVNQYALPALIIILNGPSTENATWISEDYDAFTRDFFMTVEREIHENTTLRQMAKKNGDKNMESLLLRHFSSIYVHYIPLDGFANLGNSSVIIPQIARLARRIRGDAGSVQRRRAETWSLFDARQLSTMFDYAFKHLASGTREPFDFGQCRQQVSPPATVEGHFAEFMDKCMRHTEHRNFDATASVVGSCIVRNAIKVEGLEVLHPGAVFSKELKDMCRRALDRFLNSSQICTYVHPETGEKCTNTKNGHAKGHQSVDGVVIAEGGFVTGPFDVDRFLKLVSNNVIEALKDINQMIDGNREARQLYAAERHRKLLRLIPDQSFWTTLFARLFGVHSGPRASVCYACLFGRPEYTLPCGHVICFNCIREFDQTPQAEKYPGTAMHKECVLCASRECKEGIWPYFVEFRPDLSGIRLLSLDGGGVRGIIPLTILLRLESTIDLDIPFGEFFDLMVGTSAGGLIALGLGIHNFSVRECIQHFKSVCHDGFIQRALTKNPYLGWLARYFGGSIYKTEPLEKALKNILGTKRLFGHRGNTSRVAVTTTVHSETRLLANYNWGDKTRYLNSDISTCLAARCTSAAPMYFESAYHEGSNCWDGGLKENNPVQVAVTEAKTIWGLNTPFDIILSLGCGEAKKPQPRPTSFWILPGWLNDSFATFIQTMNGNAAWDKFSENAHASVRDRCSRLNIRFPSSYSTEPQLDDVTAIGNLQELAESSTFSYQSPEGCFSPISGEVDQELLKVLAHRQMASLYFFELRSITECDEVSIIKGWICCRLRPERECYKRFIERTSQFRVNGQNIELPLLQEEERFRLEISFQQQASRDSEPLRIDVRFDHNYFVSISGFPATLKTLKSYWETKS